MTQHTRARCGYPLCGSFQTTSMLTVSTDLGKRRAKPILAHKPAPGVFSTSLSEENLTFQFIDTFSCSVAQKHRQLFTRRKRQPLPRQEDNFPRVVHGSAPQQHPRDPGVVFTVFCVCSVASNSLWPHGL